jgi:CBS domain-containing protein
MRGGKRNGRSLLCPTWKYPPVTHTIRDWMSRPVVVVDPDTMVSYAMTLMRRRGIHSVVVALDPTRQQFGIVTTTDVRDKIVAEDRNPANTRVREIMSGPIVTVQADASLEACSKLMHEHHFHHLPVVDEHGILAGMISTTDIFMAVEEAGWEGRFADH